MTADVAGVSTMNAELKPREVILTRIVSAPRELVFRAFTDANMLAKWFGPHGFHTNATSEPHPGGIFRIEMIGPDNVAYPMTGMYQEVVPNEKIVVTEDLSEHSEEWKATMRANLSGPATDHELLNAVMEVTFVDVPNNATRVTVRSIFTSDAVRDAYVRTGMNEGWSQCFERLDALFRAA